MNRLLAGLPPADLRRLLPGLQTIPLAHKQVLLKRGEPIRHVFCFIGAEPATAWLRDSGVALDTKNFILTGSDVPPDARRSNNRSGRPLPLETSVRNVFASGDVRSGSVKRVGAAIGEGAVVGAELHAALSNGAAVPARRDKIK